MSSAEQAAALLERLRAGEGEALGELFELHRERLWRMIAVRLDRRLGRRVWADDVLQEAFIDMAGKGPERNRAVDLLRQLVADFPAVPDYRMDLCETLGRPGPPGRPKEDRLEEAIQLSGKLRAEYPNVPEYTAAQARYLDLLGIVRYEARQLDEAEKLHSRAVDLQARLVQQYPQVTAYAAGSA